MADEEQTVTVKDGGAFAPSFVFKGKRMELFIIENYREVYPKLSGRDLTDRLVEDVLREHGFISEHEQVRITRLPGGKPVLHGREDLKFSVSHTGDVFGCLICREEIGLDLQLTQQRDVLRLARRYFTEDEIRYVEEGGPAEEARVPDTAGGLVSVCDGQRRRFYRLWTRKEAYAKYTGRGLEAVLEKEPALGRTDVVFEDLDFGNGLYGCICSRSRRIINGIQVSR